LTTVECILVSNLDVPIALGKGTQSYTFNPLSRFVFFAHLFTSYHVFISFVDSYPLPKFVPDVFIQVGERLWKKSYDYRKR